MQKTLFNLQNQKTRTGHIKRYSDHDLRVGKIDNLLITQASFLSKGSGLSQQKFKNIKSKLPAISSQNTFNSTQSAFHSHGKLSKMSESLSDMEQNIHLLKRGLEQTKLQFSTQKERLEDKLQKEKQILHCKVERLGEMVLYSMKEAKQRTLRLNQNCGALKGNNQKISQKIRQLKQKMRVLQNQMGIYTGEDKYLV